MVEEVETTVEGLNWYEEIQVVGMPSLTSMGVEAKGTKPT